MSQTQTITVVPAAPAAAPTKAPAASKVQQKPASAKPSTGFAKEQKTALTADNTFDKRTANKVTGGLINARNGMHQAVKHCVNEQQLNVVDKQLTSIQSNVVNAQKLLMKMKAVDTKTP